MAVDKLVDSAQLDADLTSVANAIRTKGGTSADLAFPAGFVSAVNAIPTGGGAFDWDAFVAGTKPEGDVTLTTPTKIDLYRFYALSEITSLTSNSVTEIQPHAFQKCSKLTAVNLPNITVMRNGTATNTNADGCFFADCTSLTTVKMPNLENIYGNYAFANSGWNTRVTIVLPKIQNLGVRAFRQATCAAVDLGPDLVQILADTFYNGTYDVVILRKTTVVPAATRDAIRQIRTLYVPSALVSSYATASNWSTDASLRTILPIEGSIYENAYADGTPIT